MSTGTQVIEVVRRTIHDENASTYRWSDAELLSYVNAAQRQIVILVPEANVVEDVVDLGTSRVAKQSIPAGGIKFIKASRNYADDGTTPQGVIRYAEKDALDTYDPDWEYTSTKADGDNYFEHFCHDKREPRAYFLYPAPVANNKRVAITYSDNPTELTDLSENLVLGDEYFEGSVMYVVYHALTKESRDALPEAYRQELWNNFLTSLGLKRQSDKFASPDSPENVPPEAG